MSEEVISPLHCENFRPEHNFRYSHVEQVPEGTGANLRELYVVICSQCGEVRRKEAAQ